MKKNDLLKNISSLQLDFLKLNMHLDIFPDDIDAEKELNEISQKINVLLDEHNLNLDPLFNPLYIDNPEIWTSEPWPLNHSE